jgi:hypothetical protein
MGRRPSARLQANTCKTTRHPSLSQDNSGEYMEQRRLRLGDILDDYCPRERRVTNHAVVAMVEEDVKQTRCTTCDTEHVYKGGKAPRKKKSDGTGKLYKQVLAGLTDDPIAAAAGASADADAIDEPEIEAEPIVVAEVVERAPAAASIAEEDAVDDEPQPLIDDGPVHRPLIRAQLPRIEGVKVERQAPDFTIRQTGGRGGGGNFRGGGQGHGNGQQRFGRGPHRGGGGGRGGGGQQGFGGRGQGQGGRRRGR